MEKTQEFVPEVLKQVVNLSCYHLVILKSCYLVKKTLRTHKNVSEKHQRRLTGENLSAP